MKGVETATKGAKSPRGHYARPRTSVSSKGSGLTTIQAGFCGSTPKMTDTHFILTSKQKREERGKLSSSVSTMD